MKRIELVDHDLVIYSKGKDRVCNDAYIGTQGILTSGLSLCVILLTC